MTLPKPAYAPASTAARAVTVILNPVSCPLGVDKIQEEIARLLTELGCEGTFLHTCEAETALALAQKALADGAKTIIAAGGDGTVMEALNALIGKDVPLGVIPLGTGNLLALNLDIPLTVPEAVKVAITGTSKKIDLVRVNHGEHYFAVMGGVGFDSSDHAGDAARREKNLRSDLLRVDGVALFERPPF